MLTESELMPEIFRDGKDMQVKLRLPEKVKEFVGLEADLQGKSLSKYVSDFIVAGYKSQNPQHPMFKEGEECYT